MIEPIQAIHRQYLISQRNYLQGRLFQNHEATLSLIRQPYTAGTEYTDNLLAMDNITIQTQLMAIDAELKNLDKRIDYKA